MCMEHRMRCECGSREASFNFFNNYMPAEVIRRLYCPECSKDMRFRPDSMLPDNGWVIEYDMEVAVFSAYKLPESFRDDLRPEVLFDEGFATWRGVYPGDHIDSVRERREIVKMAKVDPRGYIEKMKTWAIQRMERLRKEGWRKAVYEKV